MSQATAKRYANIITIKELDTREKRLFPFPVYDQLRNNSPVRFDEDRMCWDIFRYEDVHYVLKNPSLFSSRRSLAERSESILVMDPPRHTQLRNLVNKAFTPKAINDLAPHIADICNELLDSVANKGEMDMVHDFAGPLPVIVIAELLGIPPQDRSLFKDWSDVLVMGVEENTDEAHERLQQERQKTVEMLGQYFKGIMKQRSQKRENDLISLLLDAEIEGERLTEEEMLSFCVLLLVAGNETTTNLITNAVRYLTEDQEMQQKLREKNEIIPEAVEEVLRYYPPIQAIGRIASQDVELGGQMIKAGSQVISWVSSANRDEQKFDDPAVFIPQRKPNPHLGFGFGIHFCLGAPLARLEARISLETLLSRFSSITQKEGQTLTPIQSPFVFGVKHLHLKVR